MIIYPSYSDMNSNLITTYLEYRIISRGVNFGS
jgi:hypothetical protein